MTRKSNILTVVLLSVSVAACSTTHTLDKRVTEDNYKEVTLDTNVKVEEPLRFWASEKPEFLYDHNTQTTPIAVQGDTLNILALSGGGANGAFGAGVLMGLYDKGQLKDYSIITGISAGALIAPFVFAGGDELSRLDEVILGISDKEVLGKKNFLNTIFKDAFTDGNNFIEFIGEAYPEEMIDKIAEQHRKGKRLFIGSTHFDSGELMIWNLGAIANSDLPNRVELVHKILASSASIPGVFPPQFFDVYSDGTVLEEMHVDGGLAAQVFYNPANFDYQLVSDALGLKDTPQLDVIRNGLLKSPYKPVNDKGVALLTKSLSGLTMMQTRGDMYRMMYFSETEGLNMQFTYIDQDFSYAKESKDLFDLNYMKAIYQYGYDKVITRDLWVTELPQ
ncbi:patatin-like phospholipase family protein [Vibrio breoganii]|uniref:patatin-like phospholipase family protein n=1 Tax=Vibrio breoganii TaxID=553239 RepID=UPI0002E76436|nr:patatin-like phospholipase family protein [Vibrio breoganii]OED96958.1 phospholipase [Vibrio breoganii ZF-29]OEF86789.1 phospholipase [Vibrio breoganii 1C10]PMG07478.1 phospholipase [Vibrio breoganii]PMH20043.1 phospholipase [Vibrio breoganii]PMK55230.1 phospholipase [Vibrio breoganii]